MKTTKTLLIYQLALLLYVTETSYTQIYRPIPDAQTKAQLVSIVQQKYGSDYTVFCYVLDSLIGTIDRGVEETSEERLDPYGTLRGHIIFSASRFADEELKNTVFGLFRNGQIVWDSGPVFEGSLLQLYATADLNNDGEVDIATRWNIDDDDVRHGRSYLWIVSWNGSAGRIINQTWQGKGRTIISAVGGYKIFDANGDGVMEIRASEKTVDPLNPDEMISKPITYSWNGSMYGAFGVSVPETTFLPANRVKISVSCNVEKTDHQFTFHYLWRSAPTSKQMVRAIYYPNLPSGISVIAPTPNWEAGSPGLLDGVYWYLFDEFKAEMIKPGETKSGFALSYRSLPVIVKYFAHGRVPEATGFGSDEERQAAKRNDILTNSAQGYTIAPKDPPSPFVPLAYLDTLLSYTRQSAELGWLGRDRDNECDNDEKPEDGIVRNVEQRLKKAKRQLERGDSVLARRELEKLMGKVERLWKRSQDDDKKDKRDRWEKRDKVVITSEAYALLKYNTEFLIDRLPDRKQKKGSKEKD